MSSIASQFFTHWQVHVPKITGGFARGTSGGAQPEAGVLSVVGQAMWGGPGETWDPPWLDTPCPCADLLLREGLNVPKHSTQLRHLAGSFSTTELCVAPLSLQLPSGGCRLLLGRPQASSSPHWTGPASFVALHLPHAPGLDHPDSFWPFSSFPTRIFTWSERGGTHNFRWCSTYGLGSAEQKVTKLPSLSTLPRFSLVCLRVSLKLFQTACTALCPPRHHGSSSTVQTPPALNGDRKAAPGLSQLSPTPTVTWTEFPSGGASLLWILKGA